MDRPAAPPPVLSPRLFRTLFALGLLGCLLLLTRPPDAFLSRPFIEDTFYALCAARSLAAGQGLTVDGVHPTNGVQPLIVLLDAPLFALAGHDRTLALRLCLALQIALFSGAALAFGRLVARLARDPAERPGAARLAALLFLFNYPLACHLLNGLETGVSLLVGFMLLERFDRRLDRVRGVAAGRSPGFWLGCGVLGGLAILARVDALFLVAALALTHVAGWGAPPAGAARPFGRRPLGEAALLLAGALLVSLPWWIYNVRGFGNLVPTSGRALQVADAGPLAMLAITLRTAASAALVVIHLPPGRAIDLPSLAGVLVPLLGLGTLRLLRPELAPDAPGAALWSRHWRLRPLLPLLLQVGALTLFYTFRFKAPHFQARYLIGLRVIALALAVTTVALLARVSGAATPRGWRRMASTGLAAYLGVAALLLTRNWTGVGGNGLLAPARWVAAHGAAGARIGMFQSGTLGFLFPRVINLDGKVNAAATRALAAGRLPEYVASLDLDYLVDWDQYTRRVLGAPVLRGRFVPLDTVGEGFVIWRARRAD